MTASAVLVLNCGSSSVKFALVDPPSGRRLLSGLAERVGTPEVTLEIDTGVDTGTDTDVDTDVAAEVDAGKPRTSTPQDGSVHGILVEVLAAVGRVQDVQVGAVGHRVVHGGQRFSASVVVDDATTQAIADLADLAPLHNPANVAGIRGRQRRAAGRAAGGRVRHRLPPDHAAARLPLRRAEAWYDELRASAATASTAPATGTSAPAAAELLDRPLDAAAAGHRPPRQRLQRHRGPGRPLGRHHRWA